jgi:hypothetical protein
LDPIANGYHLTNIDKAKAFLASFEGTPADLADYRDRASACVEALKRCRAGLETQNTAAEFKIRLERVLGELLGEAPPRGRPTKNAGRPQLPEINRRDASRLRKMAAVPEGDVVAYCHTCNEEGLEITSAGIVRLYDAIHRKPRDGDAVTREQTAEAEQTPADEILALMTQLTRKITLFLNSPDGSKLKDYLQACRLGGWLQARTIKVRLDDGTYRDLPTRFRGFNALRWFIRLAGKRGVKAPEKVREMFKEAQGTDAGEWEGDTITGGEG